MAKKAQTPAPETAAEQPYYLQRAHIKDFRSIRDAEVEFKPGLNIIIGPNGSGKTNFVRCVDSTLTKSSQDFNSDVALTIVGNELLQVQVVKPDDYNDAIFRAVGLAQNRNRQNIKLSTNDYEFQEESFPKAQYELIKVKQNKENDFSAIKLITLLHGIPAEYSIVKNPIDFHASHNGGSYSIEGESLFADSLASNISSALLYAYDLLKNEKAHPTHQQLTFVLDSVENFYLTQLLPPLRMITYIQNIRFTGRFNLYTDSNQHQTIVNAFRLEFKIGADWLPFSALSSGTQRMFYIVSEIVASSLYFSLKRGKLDDKSDTIILLEEPELGIHPDQLHLLLQFLREQSKKHQLIITTHSPQVLDMLEEDELDRITICELHKTKGTQFRKLKKTQIDTAQRFMREKGLFLSDYWRYGSLEKPTKAAR